MNKEQLEAYVLDADAVRSNMIVQHCLSIWQHGDCSLDEAMLVAVRELCERNLVMDGDLMRLLLLVPSQSICCVADDSLTRKG